MSLKEYQRKRDFRVTAEPPGETSRKGWLYVIQKHAASHLHYDFRLQLGGVLKSWAVPKGPSLNPAVKRLAMHVEDHPVEYGDFEGIIPQGQYGGGTVMLWDHGDWVPIEDPIKGYKNGRLKFQLNGSKLRGTWMLVRGGGASNSDEKKWLLIKERDDEASADKDILETAPLSIVSNRTLDEIARSKDQVWNSRDRKSDQTKSKSINARPQKATAGAHSRGKDRVVSTTSLGQTTEAAERAEKRSMPKSILPQLATLIDKPPTGDRWLNEIKFDGYRMICRVEKGAVQLISRNQHDWTQKLTHLADLIKRLPVTDAVFDGEVVAMDSEGVSRFQLLQNAFREGHSDQLDYCVFDLLYLNGADLRHVALERRKQALKELLSSVRNLKHVIYTDHLVGEARQFFAEAKKRDLEGIISKLRDRPYAPGRSGEWFKSKCHLREEFVVGGFTEPSGSRESFGALLIGYFDSNHQLHFAGKVGTGFTDLILKSVLRRLNPLTIVKSPFFDFPKGRDAPQSVTWVQPAVVIQVEFSNWTDDGKLRHPAFLGLREDKPAADVTRDKPLAISAVAAKAASTDEMAKDGTEKTTQKKQSQKAKATPSAASQVTVNPKSNGKGMKSRSAIKTMDPAELNLTHPEKILYPEDGITKLKLAQYYVAVAEWMIPQVENRIAVLVRCPDGSGKQCFYQKHPGKGTPTSIRQISVVEKSSTGNYLVIDHVLDLVWLAQAGALELHVWGSRADDIERPDRLVFDLDPDPSVKWPRVVESAFQLRDFLQNLGLRSFVKTTGGKGLHLVVPIQRRSTWGDVNSFCHDVANAAVAADPNRYTANMSKIARRGKIFIDYLRNQRGATSVAPYSTRSRRGASVSVPIAWEELTVKLHSDDFTIANVPDRLANLKTDPWKEIWTIKQSITASARKSIAQMASR